MLIGVSYGDRYQFSTRYRTNILGLNIVQFTHCCHLLQPFLSNIFSSFFLVCTFIVVYPFLYYVVYQYSVLKSL